VFVFFFLFFGLCHSGTRWSICKWVKNFKW